MDLPSNLVSEFVKATRTEKPAKKESIVYGKIMDSGTTVLLDGAEKPTPVVTTSEIQDNDHVTVMIKDHTAVVTGNMTSPAVRTGTFSELAGKVDTIEANYVKTDVLEATYADIETLKTKDAEIENAIITNLTTTNAEVNNLKAKDAEIEKAVVDNLEATNAIVQNLEATNAEIGTLKADVADIENLKAETAFVTNLNGKYANVDFSNIGTAAVEHALINYGIIENLDASVGNFTKRLNGVLISGDLIEGETIKADKLLIKDDETGLYYKLNVDALGETSVENLTEEEQQELQNGLHGSVIIARSITANKISVDDLVAFGATIAGFTIKNASYTYYRVERNDTEYVKTDETIENVVGDILNGVQTTDGNQVYQGTTDDGTTIYYCREISAPGKLYSGSKASADDDATRGIYLDNEGQMSVGDSKNHIRYAKGEDGVFSLDIRTGGKSLDDKFSSLELDADNLHLEFDDTNKRLSDVESQTDTMNKYFDFSGDGFTVGSKDSDSNVVIDDDEIAIRVKNSDIQRFTAEGKALIPELQVVTLLNLLGYQIDMNENGRMDCTWVGHPPVIIEQPSNEVHIFGPGNDWYTLSIKVSGFGLKYQWQYMDYVEGADTGDSAPWISEAGQTSSILNSYSNYSGRWYYRCVITDEDGNRVVSNVVNVWAMQHFEAEEGDA